MWSRVSAHHETRTVTIITSSRFLHEYLEYLMYLMYSVGYLPSDPRYPFPVLPMTHVRYSRYSFVTPGTGQVLRLLIRYYIFH